MYITKFNQVVHNQAENIQISPSKLHHLPKNLLNSRIMKKASFLSQRLTEADQIEDPNEYSETFREMMNKVLNRICKKNNFLRVKKKEHFVSLIKDQSPQNNDSQIYQSLSIQNKINNTSHFRNKLKIQGIRKAQKESNLLNKAAQPRIYNKTSVSFLKNKQFRRNMDLRKAKSMPSYGKMRSETEKQKQNSSFLSNLERITFNNSFYPKVNEIKNIFDQSCKVDAIIPKFQIRENYQKMSELFKKEMKPKHKRIDLSKKLFHKQMVQKQKHNIEFSQSFIEKTKFQKILTQKDEQKNEFEPWNTYQDASEEIFKVYKRFPS